MASSIKQFTNFLHARKRAVERYDLRVDKDLYDMFVLTIQSRNKHYEKAIAKKILQITKRKAIWRVYYKKKYYYVVYSSSQHNIVTFLPDYDPRIIPQVV